ncbi:hypothetical protein [Sphingomonas sp. MS122]|uniref:hypothetical protein n=1 Tax=Sphingomonas sp. MS122 TaxID=3412683 RepID=UPI003C2B2320
MAADEEIERARIRQTVLAIPTSIDVGDFAAAARLFADVVQVDYTSLWGGTVQDVVFGADRRMARAGAGVRGHLA